MKSSKNKKIEFALKVGEMLLRNGADTIFITISFNYQTKGNSK